MQGRRNSVGITLRAQASEPQNGKNMGVIKKLSDLQKKQYYALRRGRDEYNNNNACRDIDNNNITVT